MRVAIVAEGDFALNNRLLKLARSLTHAGHTVVRVGIQVRPGMPLHELTDVGEIIRVRTSVDAIRHESVGNGAEESHARLGALSALKRAASALGPTDDLRHYCGRQRESRLLYEALSRWKPDAVICVNPPTMPVGARAQKELGALFIYDSQEIWIEMQPASRVLLRQMYGRLERRCARQADLVLTVNDEIADLLAVRLGVVRPMVLMNGAGECVPPTAVHTPLRVFFQGAFSPDRNLVPLVRQMDQVRGRAVLTLQGFGPLEESLRATVREQGLEDVVHFDEPCPPSDVVKHANAYDVGVIVYPLTTLNITLSSPNKLFDYVGASLAILSVDAPVLRRIITQSGCGVLVSPAELDSVWRVIHRLAEEPELVAKMKAASHRLCPSLLWDAQVEPFVEWLNERSRAVR